MQAIIIKKKRGVKGILIVVRGSLFTVVPPCMRTKHHMGTGFSVGH